MLNIKKYLIFFLLFIYVFNNILFSYTRYEDIQDFSKKSILIRSLIYPGLGHYYLDKKKESFVFFITTGVTILSTIYFYNYANNRYDKYIDSNYLNDEYYNSYSRNINIMYVILGITCLIWGYSIYDVYGEWLNYNNSINKKSNTKEDGLNLNVLNDKVMINYSKTF